MLKLQLKAGQYINIGNDIRVVYTGGGGKTAQILVDAPKSLSVVRSTLEEKTSPNTVGKYYASKELSDAAKAKIKAILMEERKQNKGENTF